jgi:predicted dehydrogenase
MKAAFIGAGWVAGRHLQNLIQEPDFEMIGHVSPIEAEREAAVQRWGGRGYTDINSLLAHESVDVVWVCVPPHQHGPIEALLIERRIPFFVEKPLSADRLTGVQIAESIKHSGLPVAVGYHWRAIGALSAVRESLAVNPARMVIGRWHDATPPPAWWHKQSTSGGQMVEQATHLIDLARSLLGNATVKAASAAHHQRDRFPDLDVDVVNAALLDFPNQTIGMFSATSFLAKPAAIDLQLICDGLLITITQDKVIFDDGHEPFSPAFGIDPFLAEDRAFMRAAASRDGSLLYSTYADALVTHHLCHDILEASHSP